MKASRSPPARSWSGSNLHVNRRRPRSGAPQAKSLLQQVVDAPRMMDQSTTFRLGVYRPAAPAAPSAAAGL